MGAAWVENGTDFDIDKLSLTHTRIWFSDQLTVRIPSFRMIMYMPSGCR